MPEVRKTELFIKWLDSLRDGRARAKILVRLRRLSLGHLGDSRSICGGVSELRIDYGPGYRVYFTRRQEAVIILLAGGTKKSQSPDIRRAISMAQKV